MTPIEATQYLERTRKTLSQWRYNKKGPALSGSRNGFATINGSWMSGFRAGLRLFGTDWMKMDISGRNWSGI